MGPSTTCQELHGGQHQLFRRLLQHSDAGSPRSESKGSSSFAVSMRSDAAQMALYAELLLHVGRSQMVSYVRREKSACKTRATRRSELGYPTVVASLTISSPRTHQGTARRAARLLTALIVQNMCRPSPSSPSPSCWLSGKNTHVRTYVRAYSPRSTRAAVHSGLLAPGRLPRRDGRLHRGV